MRRLISMRSPTLLSLVAATTLSLSIANATTAPTPSATPASSPSMAALDIAAMEKILSPELCQNGLEDPLRPLRGVIAKYRESHPSKKALQERLKGLLEQERKEGKDLPELNWVRAVNPWLLPPDFPARPAFTKCAAELRSFSDTRLDGAIDEWKECVEVAFPKQRPPEFEAIRKCLAQTAHLLPTNR